MNHAKYVSLGTNRGNRQENIRYALSKLTEFCEIQKISPIYESPALLPKGAGENWNQSFLNLCVQLEYEGSPSHFLKRAQAIEQLIGRTSSPRWSPRVMDIDILLWGQGCFSEKDLSIPHPEMSLRSFVLDPLKDIHIDYIQAARKLPQHAPLWMGILNLTPDSFSDGGSYVNRDTFKTTVRSFSEIGVHILDLGAESTRPRALPITDDDEWIRLKPYLELCKEIFQDNPILPLISVDTYKPSVAAKSIEMGVQIINDVSGLRDPDMLTVLKESDVDYVLMHSMDVPTNPKNSLSNNFKNEICNWLEQKLEVFYKNRINLGRIIFDPGIGFGKSSLQSLQLIRDFEMFHKYPVRLMLGHSRKSFMKNFSGENSKDRDVETLGLSMSLIQKKVDILRVHNPGLHIRAHRGWSHATG